MIATKLPRQVSDFIATALDPWTNVYIQYTTVKKVN